MKRFWKITVVVVGMLLVLLVLLPLVIPIPPLEDTRPVEALAGPDSRFLQVNGLQIHYQQFGAGDPAIILLHGFGASTFSWREVVQPLSQLGTVIVYDRPAQGLTARPAYGAWQGSNPYSPDTQPEILAGLMDALDIQEAILVGNSAGGTVALLAAMEMPERVRALVLVDAAVYSSGPNFPAWVRALLYSPQASRLGPWFVRSIQSRGTQLLDMAWHDPSRITPEILEGYRKPLQVEGWDAALWELTRAPREKQIVPYLGSLALPTLVITGDDDRIVPTAESIRLAGEIPGARLVVIPNCGHVPQEECPQEFLGALVPFIQEQ